MGDPIVITRVLISKEEAEVGAVVDSPWNTKEERQLCQHLDFNPVRQELNF